MMNVWFRQTYSEPGVDFPFSHLFQRLLSKEVTFMVEPSAKFLKKYGEDYKLTFNIGAKKHIKDNEIRGPGIYRKTEDVEYTIFLPFDIIVRHADAPRYAIKFLLKGVCDVFERLEINTAMLEDRQDGIIEAICSDPTMLDNSSSDDEDYDRPVMVVFEKFFKK